MTLEGHYYLVKLSGVRLRHNIAHIQMASEVNFILKKRMTLSACVASAIVLTGNPGRQMSMLWIVWKSTLNLAVLQSILFDQPGGTRANAKPPPPAPVNFPVRPKLFRLLNTCRGLWSVVCKVGLMSHISLFLWGLSAPAGVQDGKDEEPPAKTG